MPLAYGRLRLLILITICIVAVPSQGRCSEDCPSPLKYIKKRDRGVLEDLFQLLYHHGDFSHVLFGIKPMCSIDYTAGYAKCFPENKKYGREYDLAKRGFDTWKKYEGHFGMKHLHLLLTEADYPEGHIAFILINPQKCHSIITQHLSLFQAIYGKNHTAEEILEFVKEGTFFEKKAPALLGLLLGYPEQDVQAFVESKKLRLCRMTLSKNPLSPIRTPYFMTNRKEEDLQALKSEYSAQRREMVTFYYSEDFLENILKSLL